MALNLVTTEFDQKLQDVVASPVGFGNKLLYEMCKNKDGQSWGDPAILADKIWLIGRSYAASPERRYKRKPNAGQSIAGDGTGQFFAAVAKYILQHKSKLPTADFLLLNERLTFDGGEADKKRLEASINAVVALNQLLKAAILTADGTAGHEEDCRNHLSFCSKFLHFHFPGSVFIIDSYSCENAKTLLSTRNRYSLCLDSLNVSKTMRDSTITQRIKEGFSITPKQESDVSKEYLSHCLRAYTVGCIMRQNAEKVTPRAVDTFLLNLKKQKA